MHVRSNGAPLRVLELFAGVGGFRLGLEGLGTGEHPRNEAFKVVWSNQWEPATKKQHASDVYVARWGAEGHSNEDIFEVVEDDAKFAQVLTGQPDLLVGGFPCQDYSVAKPADKALGLEGKKGVLWWAIYTALAKAVRAGRPIKYLMLENVDRLLKSPSACRGRDFAIILSSLASLGYAVEWRVVNAADYGFPQRRRRLFMVGYHCSTALYAQASALAGVARSADWLAAQGVFAEALPVEPASPDQVSAFVLETDPLATQTAYRPQANGASRFEAAGLMLGDSVWTTRLKAAADVDYARFVGVSRPMTLGDVVGATALAPQSFLLNEPDVERWRAAKCGKSLMRVAANGHSYRYSEGPVPFPDPLDRPSRTVITSEGGSAASRTKHAVQDLWGRLRRLTPEELEELNGFPRGFTELEDVSDVRRAALMGNALVVGVVRALGASLAART